MAALCYDPVGQGERYQVIDREGEKMIRSWTEVVSEPENYNQLVNAVHGVLRHYVLPDLVELTMAEVSDPVDVDWRPLPVKP